MKEKERKRKKEKKKGKEKERRKREYHHHHHIGISFPIEWLNEKQNQDEQVQEEKSAGRKERM